MSNQRKAIWTPYLLRVTQADKFLAHFRNSLHLSSLSSMTRYSEVARECQLKQRTEHFCSHLKRVLAEYL